MSPVLDLIGSSKGFGWGSLVSPSPAFESIATYNGAGSSGTVTFNSIPSTFKHLQLRGFLTTSTPGTSGDSTVYQLGFNGVSSASFTEHGLYGTGTGSGSLSNSNTGSGQAYMVPFVQSFSDTTPLVFIVDILDYASTSKNKTIRSFNGNERNGSGQIGLFSGLFISTSAISSLTIVNPSYNYSTASVVGLYGIKEKA